MFATENVVNSCKMGWQKFCSFLHLHCEIGSRCFGNRLMKSFIWCSLIRHLPMMSCLIIVHYRASGSSWKLARPAIYVNNRQPKEGGGVTQHLTSPCPTSSALGTGYTLEYRDCIIWSKWRFWKPTVTEAAICLYSKPGCQVKSFQNWLLQIT